MKQGIVYFLVISAGFLLSGCSRASGDDHSGMSHSDHSAATTGSQYAGEQNRTLKALSDQEIEGLLRGEGMGFAKAAELNGYPGPRHVIDLKDQLQLTEDQLSRTNEVFRQMNTAAVELGKTLIDSEKKLEALFQEKTANAETVKTATAEIGRVRSEIRNAHLRAHLEMMSVLSEEQIAKYNELRGYTK